MAHRIGRSGWISRQDAFYAELLAGNYEDRTRDYIKYSKKMQKRANQGEIAIHKIGTHQGGDIFYRTRKRRPRRS